MKAVRIIVLVISVLMLLAGLWIYGIIGIVVAIILFRTGKGKDRFQQIDLPTDSEFIKTYTFDPTGSIHNCRFPDSKMTRQSIIRRTKIGDRIELRKYEWQGEPAVAFINTRFGRDVGVASVDRDLDNILTFMDDYLIYATVVDVYDFVYEDETYKGLNIELKLYSKTPKTNLE